MSKKERNKDVPKFNELMWPALNALKDLDGSGSVAEILEQVVENERIPEEIQDIVHTDGRNTRIYYNLAWSLTYLKKIGAVNNSTRGIWAITDFGEELDEAETMRLLAEERNRQQRKGKKRRGSKSEDDSPDEDDWKTSLLNILKKMDPSAFERLAQRILRESGFIKVEVTGKSGDGGIDGLGALRVNNLLSFQVYFQCKRYSNKSVSAGEVRDFLGAMVGRSEKGLFITTSTFTTSAREEAQRDGVPKVDLIDGDQLCELLKSLNLGVTTELQEVVSVEEGWFEGV